MKKNLALFYGGNSSESEISIMSGRNVASYIDRSRYDVYEVLLKGRSWSVQLPVTGRDGGYREDQEVEIDKTDFSFTYNGMKVVFDMAFIMIHGKPGEDGVLQGYLEMMGIPFNTSSAFVAAISFDKLSCKRYLDFAGVNMARDIFLRKGSSYSCDDIIEKLGLPLFVKPTNGGSSFGVSKVKSADMLDAAIEAAFAEHDGILVEECLTGREMTNGIYMKDGVIMKLPVTEIIPEGEYFDYDAKYSGKSEEICPADISENLAEQIQDLTEKIYKYLGCKGLVRVDYMLDDNNEIYFMEMNNTPGMTLMSLVPKEVEAAGIDMYSFINTLVDEIS
ncbi:MAG: D-alanine--D-alanine ligase [Bacteroidales bacterium]|jgi:D-alanine-D-alanine ligase|nr:D-alanine--D-alanine ligase [Bacteroidales bacterium]